MKIIKAVGLVMALHLGGCSLYSSDKKQTYADAEGRIPERLLSELANPKLGKSWVLAQLGPATQMVSVNSNSNVYTWTLTRTEVQHTQLFLLYNSNKRLVQRDYLHIVFRGDEVLKHWIDRDLAIDNATLFSRREAAKIAAAEKTSITSSQEITSDLELPESQLMREPSLMVPRKPQFANRLSPAKIFTTINSPNATVKRP